MTNPEPTAGLMHDLIGDPPSARPLELLAPARSAAFGIEAINHGADAVYIGGPSFGARSAAGNAVADIAALAEYAHRYHAQVFVALNTILAEDELEPARRLAWEVYEAGVDALIVQDMGLLELDLPPLALHASTQTDNRSVEKVDFLARSGFSRVVLARELSLQQIGEIVDAVDVELEYFIHGALCVSYSGQCYVSHAQTGRSANRGDCSQMCRLPFSVVDNRSGAVIVRDRHVLSPKDNNQTGNLAALAAAGVSSFKVEGRLKDLDYVKNITAHYRRELDRILEGDPRYRPAADGRCTFFFQPQPEKSFNRGFTDYFARARQRDLLALDSPKHVGEALGTVVHSAPGRLVLASRLEIGNGDGISWYDRHGVLQGMRISCAVREPDADPQPVSSAAEGRWSLYTGVDAGDHSGRNDGDGSKSAGKNAGAPLPPPGTPVYRNLDRRFQQTLAGHTAERRIGVTMRLSETADGYQLRLEDAAGHVAEAAMACEHQSARDAGQAGQQIAQQLRRLGNTIFVADDITLALAAPRFIPASRLNALRRDAVARLEAVRSAARRRPPRRPAEQPPVPYPQRALSYLGNVYNSRARQFYQRHGVALIDDAYEANRETGEVSLMITKHCIRHSFNLCPKEVPGIKADPLTLASAGENLRLEFDCKRCEMHVLGRLRDG